tara:strand:+ start:10880 stop:11743 length:864 start_codon:yes stop_codon:yes gene_type:complete
MNPAKVFVSNDNKRILWDFLLNNNIFNNIPSDKEQMVKQLFEKKIVMVEKTIEPTDTVTKLNKRFISTYVKDLKQIKKPPKKVYFEETSRVVSKDPLHRDNRYDEKKTDNTLLFQERLSDQGVITAEKHKEMRQRDFNNKLETRQKDFAEMFAKNTPADIDFSDIQEEEDGYIDNMDERISEIMSSREKDLKELFEGKPEDAKKLIDTTSPLESPDNTLFTQKMRLNIGKDTEIDDVQHISSKKKIDDVGNIESSKNITDSDLSDLLNNILDNQKVILERLDSLHKL